MSARISTANAATELSVISQSINLDVVDLLDSGVIDAQSTNIPGSGDTPLTVVASLAGEVKRIKVFDTTGEFIGLYSDPAGTPLLMAVFGPGMDGDIDLEISSGTVLGVRSMSADAIEIGKLAINFMG